MEVFVPTDGVARDWDRIADGRAAIAIKNVKFAFPSAGNDLDRIHFNQASLTERTTLREAIVSPDKVQKFFENDADVNISIYVGTGDSLFLGRFERADFRSFSFSFDVGENQRNCRSWAKIFDRAKLYENDEPRGIVGGWRESDIAGITKVYTYAGSQSFSSDQHHLPSLYCNEMSECGSSICLRPNLSFQFKFSNKRFPQKTWFDVVNRVDDVLAYLLLAPTGSDQPEKD